VIASLTDTFLIALLLRESSDLSRFPALSIGIASACRWRAQRLEIGQVIRPHRPIRWATYAQIENRAKWPARGISL
jgi:hypothetical protein